MLYEYLQVTDTMMDARSRTLARLLSLGTRKVSRGDALLLMLEIDRHFMQLARDTVPDLRAELQRVSLIPTDKVNDTLSVITEWPDRQIPGLLNALSDPSVGVLEPVDDGWQVAGLVERYAGFVEKRRDSRGRAKTSRMAKSRGWKPAEGGGWYNVATGETVEDWQALLTRMESGT